MVKEKNENLPATTESQDIFARFEELDDSLILKELENQVVDDWVYHFTQDGHEIWGLGKVGVDACAKEMGIKGVALREDSIEFEKDPTHPEFMLFTAKVSKHVVAKGGAEAMVESAIGTKRQWIMLKRRSDGKIVANKFWFEQGSIKALRNAKSRLIPDDIKTKIIAFAKSHKKVKEIEPPAKKKKEDNGIADLASQGPGKEEFKTIPITIKNKTTMYSKFEMLERFGEAKLELGGQLYYKVLGEHGYEKSNQIPEKDIPKIYYAMLEAHEAIAKQAKKAAKEKKDPEKKKPAAFSDDKEKDPESKPETLQPEMPLQQEIMELTKLETILVDKHDFAPAQIIGKLKEMFGEEEGTKLTKDQNKEAIEYFKGEIEKLST